PSALRRQLPDRPGALPDPGRRGGAARLRAALLRDARLGDPRRGALDGGALGRGVPPLRRPRAPLPPPPRRSGAGGAGPSPPPHARGRPGSGRDLRLALRRLPALGLEEPGERRPVAGDRAAGTGGGVPNRVAVAE